MPRAVVSALVLAALAAKKRPMDITPRHADEAVEALDGQTLRVRLPATPSTGYTWTVRVLKGDAVAQQGKPVFERAEATEGKVGAGGTLILSFRAVKPGRSTVLFEYQRPWEEKDPARTQVLRFTIQPDDRVYPEPARGASS
ncbi:MAG: protease inhibitor I42 family protein [Planctomycetota bacterium]